MATAVNLSLGAGGFPSCDTSVHVFDSVNKNVNKV